MLGGEEKPRPRRAGLESHQSRGSSPFDATDFDATKRCFRTREIRGAGVGSRKKSVLRKEGSLDFRSKAIRGLQGGSYSGEHRHKNHEERLWWEGAGLRACTHKSTTLIDVRLALTSGA